jgi:hypothetical protein
MTTRRRPKSIQTGQTVLRLMAAVIAVLITGVVTGLLSAPLSDATTSVAVSICSYDGGNANARTACGDRTPDDDLRAGPAARSAALIGVVRQVHGSVPVMLRRIATEAGTAVRRVGDALESVDDVFANPRLLEGDLADPSRVRAILEGTPGWKPGVLGRGEHAGQGWTFREMNRSGTDFTDRYIQWHPGGGRHGPSPYWKVSSGQTGTVRIGVP